MRDTYERGAPMTDEAGPVRWNGWWARYSGDPSLLRESVRGFEALAKRTDAASLSFRKYLPEGIAMEGDEMVVTFSKRSLPLSGRSMPQKHVNWVLSRMLEFSAWLDGAGYTHCGLNPESVFVVPENHGIQVPTFYLLTAKGSRMKGLSGKYSAWYPPAPLAAKTATPEVDIELCKRTACYLLGDRSGAGVRLRRDPSVSAPVLEFALGHHEEAGPAWKEYRRVLDANFKKEFHTLDI